MKIVIAHLYPRLMNIYGDQGNIDCLVYRCQKRGINVDVKHIRPQNSLKQGSFDLLFAGGGQDRQQLIIAKDLLKKSTVIKKAFTNKIPMLTICGSYQLFGAYFKPFNGSKLKGINIFDSYTVASKVRKIGNVFLELDSNLSIDQSKSNKLIGFENHSGNTYIKGETKPLGKVIHGFGNNGQDGLEGAYFNNAFGCYLHGSLLPKNPHFADYLISKALEIKYQKKIKLKPLDDQLEWQAHQAAINRTKKLASPLVKYLKFL